MPHFAAADGCRLYYETHGTFEDTEVVVLINGLTQTTVNWAPSVRRLTDRFGVVTYDARGQGRSGLGTAGLPLRVHAEDVTALVDHLALPRVHLVGMSLGGRVALAAAGRRPERVDRLVVCSTLAEPCEPGSAMVRSWLEILRAGGLEAMAWAMLPGVFGKSFLQSHGRILDKLVKAISWRNRAEAVEAQLSALSAYPANIDLAGKVAARTLVLSGAEDLLVPPENARTLAVRCRGRHRLLEGIGHSVPAEAPERFVRMAVEFLTE